MGVTLAPNTVEPAFVEFELVHAKEVCCFTDDAKVEAVQVIILCDRFPHQNPHRGSFTLGEVWHEVEFEGLRDPEGAFGGACGGSHLSKASAGNASEVFVVPQVFLYDPKGSGDNLGVFRDGVARYVCNDP